MIVKKTGSNHVTPSMSAGKPKVGPNAERIGPAIQISRVDWTHERVARRTYELYEQRGQQDGRAIVVSCIGKGIKIELRKFNLKRGGLLCDTTV
ncbi:DUF2934 domain-containing protein [Petrachloros mirabilis]